MNWPRVRHYMMGWGALGIGTVAYLWPGGPNILMLFGAVILMLAFVLDESDKTIEEVSDNAEDRS